jgi:hypothetical protein
MENLIVEKDEGVESLVLGGGGHFLVHGQIGEESLDFGSSHLAGMTFLMEEDVAFDPENIYLLRAEGVMLHTKDFADLIQEFGFWIGHDPGGIDEVIPRWPKRATLPRKLMCCTIEHFMVDERNE